MMGREHRVSVGLDHKMELDRIVAPVGDEINLRRKTRMCE